MRIIGFVERTQPTVIEKILRHCGLWKDAPPRPPPKDPEPDIVDERARDYGDQRLG